MEISPNSGFYLSREKIAYIELRAAMNNNKCDWKKLVRETLLEVYGESITNYSATGKRGSRPAISAILFKALFSTSFLLYLFLYIYFYYIYFYYI